MAQTGFFKALLKFCTTHKVFEIYFTVNRNVDDNFCFLRESWSPPLLFVSFICKKSSCAKMGVLQ